jgi:aspartyl-tRNA(Asn)/glutamyl-tRNA(Gln) amidotransferase subunit C
MTEEITKDIFAKLVSLAALELNTDESDYLRGQLNKQLLSVHELEAIPLSPEVPLARHGVPFPAEISPDLRKDVLLAFPNSTEIMKQGPQTADNYFVVPEIPHTRLE